jgi:cob(I)alamin adenosyltransferase
MNKKKLKFLEPKKKVGLIVIITGHGKGKTTAALGMALRAVGHGMRVCIIEFIKGDIYSGEIDGVKELSPHIEFHMMGCGFYRTKEDPHTQEKHRNKAQKALKLAEQKMLSGKFDILILDEINVALTLNLIDLTQILALIKKKPPLMHLILTGRGAHPELTKRAHTVTEMKEIQHAFRKGIEPQKGIDF